MAEADTKSDRTSGRREEILRETLQALGEDSFDKFSLRDIAKRLSISLGNLQYYFPTKDDLFFAACEAAQENYDRNALAMAQSQASGIDGILKAFDWYIHEFNQPYSVIWLFLAQVGIRNARFKALRDQSYVDSQSSWQKIIERSGLKIAPADARDLATAILAFLDGFALRNFPADTNDPAVKRQLEVLRGNVVTMVEDKIRP